MTTLIAQGSVDVNVRGLLARLQARADNAYCDYIGLCRRDECLGWEAKVEKQIFGEAELKAHKDAAEKLGRHRALQEAANLLHELLTPNDLGNRRAAFGASALTDELERLTHEDLRKWAEALDKEMPRGLGERLLRFAEAWREQVDCSNTNKA